MLFKMGEYDCTYYHLPLFQSQCTRFLVCARHTALLFNSRI
nr:MAG TPA: hypothetical protein [Caudoviricetes sp.]